MTHSSTSGFSVARFTRYTFGGWVLGVVLILVLSSLLDSMGIEGMQFYLGLGMGAGVGLAQWWMLRKYAPVSSRWIAYAVFGLGLPFLISDVFFTQFPMTYKMPILVGLGALIAGFLQASLLQKTFPHARQWITGSFVSWLLGVGTVFLMDFTMQIRPTQRAFTLAIALLNLLLILGGGVLLGVTSGRSLRSILNNNR